MKNIKLKNTCARVAGLPTSKYQTLISPFSLINDSASCTFVAHTINELPVSSFVANQYFIAASFINSLEEAKQR